ncbi:unnamed protein product [Arabis nemorensis]|uniref:Uncharacterized protein n=1 Tax=Arabis nemorensis TaxID=586526 RepID=A0A565B301_9BRAS|nr:unnamed protein product [Arabis nemorensis]
MSGKGAIGIDLGTTNSCVGEIIPHDQGNRTTMDPVNTVFDDAKKQDDDEAKQFLVDIIVNETIRNSIWLQCAVAAFWIVSSRD